MTKTTVIDFTKPSDFSPDPLTDVLRAGARELLATAVRAEVSEFLAGHIHFWTTRVTSGWYGTGFCRNAKF